MENCIFCKIIAGDIPSYKIYEDAEFLAFLDIRPLTKGHALVIPKKHYRWVWDVENISGYYSVVKKIANAQKHAFGTDRIFSLVFGEEVPHAHVWLIPRYDDDGHGPAIDLKNIQEYSPDQMMAFAEAIKNHLSD